MKLRDMMFLVIGGLLVISGMVLNTLLSGDAEAQEGEKDATGYITCKGLIIKDGDNQKGYFGLDAKGNAQLTMYGDDKRRYVAYLGGSPKKGMRFYLSSEIDTRMAVMSINENGGRFDSFNKRGRAVAIMAVGNDGSGGVTTRYKSGDLKSFLQ